MGCRLACLSRWQTESWSVNAGDVAAATYAAYRVLNGAVSLQPAGTVTHALSDGDGTLQVAALKTASVKELANDVTVSGEMEPTAYVTETFAGDGTTTVFQLVGGAVSSEEDGELCAVADGQLQSRACSIRRSGR